MQVIENWPKVTPSHVLAEKVCQVLGLNPRQVTRIVIDLDCRGAGPVLVYVMMLGSEGLLGVDWGGTEFKIISAGGKDCASE
jgi:hypothetical protein